LDRTLSGLRDEILLMGSMVEQIVTDAVQSLKERDVRKAWAAYDEDQAINDKRFALENAIVTVIATQQPMAHDIRALAAMLEVISELERMGDYGKGISKTVIRLGSTEVPVPYREIDEMLEQAVSMLHRGLSAFVSENANLAAALWREDDQVDDLYNRVYHLMIAHMIQDPSITDPASLILWVAHNLERFADRVTNICERTVYSVTGELLEFEGSDDEDLPRSGEGESPAG
jgi:phosphate transport system protein